MDDLVSLEMQRHTKTSCKLARGFAGSTFPWLQC